MTFVKLVKTQAEIKWELDLFFRLGLNAFEVRDTRFANDGYFISVETDLRAHHDRLGNSGYSVLKADDEEAA